MSRANEFEKIPEERERFILQGMMSHAPFPNFLGMQFEEVRLDYGRISLPFRPEFNQPAGMIHGGVIASLIDTVVVGPLLSALDRPPRKLLTIDLHVHYFDAGVEEDLVAEGWVKRRGRSTAFVGAEVATVSGKILAEGNMAYRIVP
ncbi:PaaI family thioesterase [Deltaproteobacteria bacterium]|jgi:uncharacterized protein (TIGR00369 family)|nr:PaaI family thioesterase [Deltaproteobacteria bacterium]